MLPWPNENSSSTHFRVPTHQLRNTGLKDPANNNFMFFAARWGFVGPPQCLEGGKKKYWSLLTENIWLRVLVLGWERCQCPLWCHANFKNCTFSTHVDRSNGLLPVSQLCDRKEERKTLHKRRKRKERETDQQEQTLRQQKNPQTVKKNVTQPLTAILQLIFFFLRKFW